MESGALEVVPVYHFQILDRKDLDLVAESQLAGHIRSHLPELLELEPVTDMWPEVPPIPKWHGGSLMDEQPAPQAEEPAPAAPAAKPLPSLGNPNCARVPFVDDKPAMEVVVAKRVTDSGFLDCVPAQVVAAIPESNGGGGHLIPAATIPSAQEGVRILMFDGHPIRTGGDIKNPWFCVIDALRALDDKPRPNKKYNVTEAVKELDEDELINVELTDVTGRKQPTTCVYKSGLFFLAEHGRKEACKKFRRWLRKDVLKEIDDTGTYSTPGTQLAVRDDQLALALQGITGAMTAITSSLMATTTEVGHVSGRMTAVETRQAQSDEPKPGPSAGWLPSPSSKWTPSAGHRHRHRHRGCGFPSCRRQPNPGVANPEGRILADQQYLSAHAYEQLFFPRGFEAEGLNVGSGWFGRRATAMCVERGLAMPELPQIGIDYLVRCYPLSVLYDVAEASRRGAAGPQMALAA